ncbi:Histidinol dehydrogenase [bioreactor metagenome]|uniref:Histidinol dehydrogenase n=2 Tax=root TaxID=1 RepID=A0A645ADP6_9ZZZZ
MEQALAVADAYAAEHLEIHTRDADALAQRVTNAGAIFIGTWSPVSLGDYLAGSTHVLPTGGGAKHSSGLNVKSFLRAVHLIRYQQGATDAVAKDVIAFAESEDLPSHGNALRVRVEDPDGSRA